MSVDVVDDLHAAEDFASSAVAALESLLTMTRSVEVDAVLITALLSDGFDLEQYRVVRGRANDLVASWGNYCRPSCGAEGDPESEGCTEEDCGCPCDHRDAL